MHHMQRMIYDISIIRCMSHTEIESKIESSGYINALNGAFFMKQPRGDFFSCTNTALIYTAN